MSEQRITCESVCRVVAAHYEITRQEIRGESHEYQFSHPRQLAMFLAREFTSMSYTRIGHEFGRDHSTVINACKVVRERLKTDLRLVRAVVHLRGQLRRGEIPDYPQPVEEEASKPMPRRESIAAIASVTRNQRIHDQRYNIRPRALPSDIPFSPKQAMRLRA